MKKRFLSAIILIYAAFFTLATVFSLGGGVFLAAKNQQVYAEAPTTETSELSETAPKDLEELQNASSEQLDFWADNLSSFDGRTYDIITPTRNQGQKNICWVYAPIAAVETNILRKGIDGSATKDNLDFDEMVLSYARFNRDGLHDQLFLTTDDRGLAGGMWNSGDNGGNAYAAMTEGYTLVDENSFGNDVDENALNGALMQSKYYVKSYQRIPKEDSVIKRAILKYGAVSFSYVAPSKFESKYYSGNSRANHESLIVGWDDSVSKSGFSPQTPSKNGAWIVKNSWGNYYGQTQINGVSCFYMSYDEPFIKPYVVDMEMREDYQNVYHYDGQLSDSTINQPAEKQAAIYEAKLSTSLKREQLTAAAITVNSDNIDVTVSVHRHLTVNPGDVNDAQNNPEQGDVIASKSVHIDNSGYHTIEFDRPVDLEQGEYFSIVTTCTDADDNPVLIACTRELNNNSVNDMTYYFEGGEWASYKQSSNYADTSNYSMVARIRAITNAVDRGEDLGKNLKYARIEIEDRLVFYEAGKSPVPQIEVYFGEELLERDEDYQVEVQNNNQVGKATVIITGTGDFTGTRTTYFEIAKAKYPPGRMSGTVVVYDDVTMLYEIQIPKGWQWIDGDKPLQPGKSQYQFSIKYVGSDIDYYQNNICGFFVDKRDGNPPEKTDISLAAVEISGKYYYTGEQIVPTVKVTYAGKELSYLTDYDLTFQNNVNAGTATVTVEGRGDFTGQSDHEFEIRRARWQSDKPQSAITVGKNVRYLREIPLGQGWEWQKDLEITGDEFEAVAVYNGQDKNNFANLRTAVVITRESDTDKKNISSITLDLDRNSFVYDGGQKKPTVIAKDGEKTLNLDADYQVEYKNNRDAGEARVVVTGLNGYKGTKTLYFTIQKADVSGFEVSQQGWTYGDINTPNPTVGGDIKSDVTFTYSSEKDGVYSQNKPQNAGMYWIKAEVAATQNYNSAEAKAQFTIERAEQPAQMPQTAITVARKVKTLQSVTLASGWKWEDPDLKIDNETIEAYAVYSDRINYKNDRVLITIKKEPPKQASQLSVALDEGPLVYDGTFKTPKIIAKDGALTLSYGEDYDVQYQNNKFAGQGKATVTFKNDYAGTRELTFTISKAEKPSVNTTIYYSKKAATLSDIPLPSGFVWDDGSMEITGNKLTAKAVYCGDDADSFETTELYFEIVLGEQTPPAQTESPAQKNLIWLAAVIPVAVAAAIITAVVVVKKKR